MRDGRSLVRVDYGAGTELTDLQTIFESQAMAETFELIAPEVSDSRCSARRSPSRAADPARPGVYDSMGLAEIGRLVLHEVDDQERFVLTDVFDPDAVDAAYEALDERYATGEGRPAAGIVRLGSRFTAATVPVTGTGSSQSSAPHAPSRITDPWAWARSRRPAMSGWCRTSPSWRLMSATGYSTSSPRTQTGPCS